MEYCAQLIFQGRISKQKHNRNKITCNTSTIWLLSNGGVQRASTLCETTLNPACLNRWPFGFQVLRPGKALSLNGWLGSLLRGGSGGFFRAGRNCWTIWVQAHSTLRLHGPPSADFYNKRFEPLRRIELIEYGHLTKLTSKVLLYLHHQNHCHIPYPTANCVFQLYSCASDLR